MKTFGKMVIVMFMLFAVGSWLYADDKTGAPAEASESHIGIVKETHEKDRYVYLRLDEDGKEVWIATMISFFQSKVTPGDKVEYIGGDQIQGFESKAMGRTFDNLWFVTRIRSLKDAETQEKAVPGTAADADHGAAVKVSPPASGSIKKPEHAKNISELFAQSDRLNNKEILLKAKVMKVSRNILGKTWVTLQDGTGTVPDNAIIAVTADDAQIGDILTVKGILKTNVNLGAGYQYKALIDEATLSKPR